jgi:hypothetical protein
LLLTLQATCVKTRQQRPKQKKTESTPTSNSSSDAIAASTEAFAGTEENATTSAYSNLIVLLDALMKCTKDTPMEDVLHLVVQGMTLMDMKQRQQGSVSFELKYKSLHQRWFSLGKKEASETLGSGVNSRDVIGRDVVITLKLDNGRALYVIMGMYNKHYNKWYLTQQKADGLQLSVEQQKTQEDQQVRLHIRKVVFDSVYDMYTYDVGDGQTDQHDIYKQIKVNMVQAVKGRLKAV